MATRKRGREKEKTRWEPSRHVRHYTSELNRILAKTITEFRLTPKPRKGSGLALIQFIMDPPIRLECSKKLNGVDKHIYFSFEQTIRTLSDSEIRRSRKQIPITVLGYTYVIQLNKDGASWLTYHYESGKDNHCKCHMHLEFMNLPKPEGAQTIYACPVHPRITNRRSGKCYACDLQLLPMGKSSSYVKLHVPTARVSLEHLIIFLVSDLKVSSKLTGRALYRELLRTFNEFSQEATLGIL